MRQTRRGLMAVCLAIAAFSPGGAHATVPKSGWMPASFGMLPACGKYQSDGYLYNGCLITRRIRFDPHVPGRMYAGTLFNGPWVSANGMTWKPLVAGCQTNLYTVQGVDPSGLLPCGVDDIAFDPQTPNTIYISTYVFSNPYLTGYHIEPGGIFRSTDGGLTWALISSPLRGAALTVIHPPGEPVTIMAGSIQHADHDVGGAASLVISNNGGTTWRRVVFKPTKGCAASAPVMSSNLVASLVVNPKNPNIVYAGSNGGLYQTIDRGRTWSLVLNSCLPKVVGSTWGVEVTPNGSTIYAGSWDGVVRMASTNGLSTKSWRTMATLQGTLITDVLVDSRDSSGQTVWVATLDKGRGAGRQAAGVYKVRLGQKPVLFDDSVLGPLNHQAGALTNLLPVALVKSAPAFWLAQSPIAPDLIYLSQSQGGIFVRSDGEELPKLPV